MYFCDYPILQSEKELPLYLLNMGQQHCQDHIIRPEGYPDPQILYCTKGSGTLVAQPDGTLWRCSTGNAGLAKGGSGDVLAGMTAGLLAAGLPQGRTAAQMAALAVWLHGEAADRCAQQRSMTAMLPQDMFEELGYLLTELEG